MVRKIANATSQELDKMMENIGAKSDKMSDEEKRTYLYQNALMQDSPAKQLQDATIELRKSSSELAANSIPALTLAAATGAEAASPLEDAATQLTQTVKEIYKSVFRRNDRREEGI